MPGIAGVRNVGSYDLFMMRIFESINTCEFEIESEKGLIHGRIELMRNVGVNTLYRMRLYESDMFRLEVRFSDSEDDSIAESDELVWTQRGFPPIGKSCIDFESGNDDHARQVVFETIDRIRAHIIDKTG